MPPDVLAHPVDVLLQLPDEAALADPTRPRNAHKARPRIAADPVQDLLELAQLLVAADERRLEGIGSALATPVRHDADSPPRGHRAGLALQGVLAERFEHDRPLGSALRRLADEDGPGIGNALQAGRGVHEIAGDHALVRRPEGYGRLSREDAGPRREPGLQAGHPVDDLERGAHRPLRIVLVGYRRAPDRHDRVTDELLDRPAVDPDHLGGGVEVAREELPDGLGIAVLRQRREPDEIGEQDRDETSFGHRRLADRSGWRLAGSGRGALRAGDLQPAAAGAAEPRGGLVGVATRRARRRELGAAVDAVAVLVGILRPAAGAARRGGLRSGSAECTR